MLSLANAFDENDLVNFEKKILNFISQKNDFNISYSACLLYTSDAADE